MYLPDNEEYVISTMGWVERGSMWIYDTKKEIANTYKFSSGAYAKLHKGKNGHFVVQPYFEGERIELTIHHESNPREWTSPIL